MRIDLIVGNKANKTLDTTTDIFSVDCTATMYNFGYHSALLSYVGRYNMGWFVYQTAIRLRMHIRTHQLVRNVLKTRTIHPK
jgi:hypothetical protein